jgi:hypothetical protein
VALNTKTPKAVLNKLLKDEYRWVREAAASHPEIDTQAITKLIRTGDRYILKGLGDNPNCDKAVQEKINKILKDEDKYPVEKDTYEIEARSWGCSEYVGGSMTVEEMAEAITQSDGSELPGDWYEYDDIYHCFGDYNLKDEIKLPDGTSESLNLELNTDICDNDTDFVMYANTDESGNVDNFTIEIEDLFDPSKVTVDECDGLVSGYNYDDEYFDGSADGESIPGDGYALPSLTIYVKTGTGYEDFYLEDEISNMEDDGVDSSDSNAVLEYFKKTYNL